MANSSKIRRKLFMHAAHPAVGLAGGGAAYRSLGQVEDGWAREMVAEPIRVLLAVCEQNVDARSAGASFERLLRSWRDAQCRRVNFGHIETSLKGRADADCMVILGRGLHLARAWSDFDADAIRRYDSTLDVGAWNEVEIAPVPRWHPVLEGVGRFVARGVVVHHERADAASTCLLTGNIDGEPRSVAWTRRGRCGNVFSTRLGSVDDFRRPAFARLVLNAVNWICP